MEDIHELKSNAVASPADLGRIHQIKVQVFNLEHKGFSVIILMESWNRKISRL